jgi:small-conductance mechanosensitive channel
MGTEPLNIRGIIDESSHRTTLSALQKRGIQRVRLIDEKQILELIAQAVRRTVSDQAHLLSEQERGRIHEAARQELARLLKEQQEFKSRAEKDREELLAEVENLQKQVALTRELTRQEERKKYGELQRKAQALAGQVAALTAQLREREQASQQELARRLASLEARLDQAPRDDGSMDEMRRSLGGIARKIESIRVKVSPQEVAFKPGQVTLGELIRQDVESNIDAVGLKHQQGGSVDGAIARLRGLRTQSNG